MAESLHRQPPGENHPRAWTWKALGWL